VQYGVYVPGNGYVVRHIMPCEPEARIRKQVSDVLLGACDEIVQTENIPAFLNKVIA
jgi:hypothetical protein